MTHTAIFQSLPHSVQTEQPRGTGPPDPQYRSVSQPGNPFTLHYLRSEYPREYTLPLSCTAASPQYVIQFVHLGPEPYSMICPACGSVMITTIKYEPMLSSEFTNTSCAWIWSRCFWLACSRKCLTVKHYCSNCAVFLGKY